MLFDTNIVLDVLMDRKPFSVSASALFDAAERGIIAGYLCGTTLTTVYYIVAKTIGPEPAKNAIKKLLAIFEVAPVNRAVIESALAGTFKDFEDALLYESANHTGIDAIVTRNESDFRKSSIPVYSPEHAENIIAELLSEKGK